MCYKMKLFSVIFFLLTFQVFEKQCNAIANDSIPAKEKIFRPFCTTKPFGGERKLGLSLAHNIVKAHDGSLDVESTVANTENTGVGLGPPTGQSGSAFSISFTFIMI